MSLSASSAPLCTPFDPQPRAPECVLPANACDTHAHICGPLAAYPIVPESLYTPALAPLSAYRHLLDTLGVTRGVLVQPSVYGTDLRALLDALEQDPLRLRGVAVVPMDVSEAQLAYLHACGVRGVRCNIVDLKHNKGVLPLAELTTLAQRIRPMGWHMEFLMHVDAFADLDQQLKNFPVDVVFGHLGYVPVTRGIATPGFQALLRLMQTGNAWVKLTAPYRLASSAADFVDTDIFARALLSAAPERLLWGSDWPHVMVKPPMPNDGDLFNVFARWVSDQRVRDRILVDNPATLYDF